MAYRGQTAVITGGTGGIGYAIARQLLCAGAAVRSFNSILHFCLTNAMLI